MTLKSHLGRIVLSTLSSLPIAGLAAIGQLWVDAAPAVASPGEGSFSCQYDDGFPTTVFRVENGPGTIVEYSLIRWSSRYFEESGWTPERRCEEVSRRFQSYYEDGILRYLIVSEINNQGTICAVEDLSYSSLSCNLLLTVKPFERPQDRLLELESRLTTEIASRLTPAPMYEGGRQNSDDPNAEVVGVYYDIGKLLEDLIEETQEDLIEETQTDN